MENLEELRKELTEKILAKRQQVEFEKRGIQEEIVSSEDNRETPDVSQEFKNFNDPAIHVVEGGELKELSRSEQELVYLIDKLNKLNKEL